MTIREFKKYASGILDGVYLPKEAQNITNLALEEVLNFNTTQLFLNENKILSSTEYEKLNDIVQRAAKNEPIQYILGYAYFYGRKFRVDNRVLIPRPETEELVEWVIAENQNQDIRILDIGSGSGCISITLDLELPLADVSGMDVSKDALIVSSINNSDLGASVNFIEGDFIDPESLNIRSDFDVIVCNPPYISKDEKKLMSKSTIQYEPSLALFIKDIPEVYSKIADLSRKLLRENGKLYLEINEFHLEAIVETLENSHFRNIELREDLSGKSRMIRAAV